MAVNNMHVKNGSCALTCPTGQYIFSSVTQMCANCDANCTSCTGGSNLNCTSCSSISFSLNTTQCYNILTNSYFDIIKSQTLTYYNPCPAPYYAWPLTRVCLSCTAGCASCSIALEYLMSDEYKNYKLLTSNPCSDSTCSYTLKCYSCTNNYTLVQYFCLPNNKCR